MQGHTVLTLLCKLCDVFQVVVVAVEVGYQQIGHFGAVQTLNAKRVQCMRTAVNKNCFINQNGTAAPVPKNRIFIR